MSASNELKLLIEEKNINGVDEFIKNGGLVNGFYEDGSTPLLYAIEKQSQYEDKFEFQKMLLLLICGGADLNVKHLSMNCTPLMLALKCKSDNNVICELLNAGANVNGLLVRDGTVVYEESWNRSKGSLISALENGYDKSLIAELIRRGANVNHRDTYGKTPLFYVLERDDHFEIATMLIDAGAVVNALDFTDMNVLFQIRCDNKCSRDYCKRNKKVIDLFLDKGADIKQTDSYDGSVMHSEDVTNCNYLINLCLKSGLSVDLKDIHGQTPLINACVCDSDSELVESLLFLFNADVNCVDENSNTALHYAALSGNDKSCDLLLYCGSDMFTTNKYDKTPFYYACVEIDDLSGNRQDFLALFRYYLLFINENNFSDHFQNCSDVLQRSVELFRDCQKEVNKLKNTFLKVNLSFYDFLVLKRFRNSKTFVNISVDEYTYTIGQIKETFPLYYYPIIIRLKDNQIENNKRRLMRGLEKIVIRALPYNESVMEDVKLIYDCKHLMSRYLDYYHLYNLFLASVDH